MRYILLVAALALFACSKKQVPTTEIYGLDYYPLSEGRFVVYSCDSTVYTEIPRDTIYYHFQLKEILAGTYTDNEGKEAWLLKRFVKVYNPAIPYDSMPWRIREVAMVNADQKKVQLQENNTRNTRLIFPVKEKGSWDGNAGNTDDEQLYSYDYIDRTETIASTKLDKVLLVKQLDFPTLISKQFSVEKYAAGIGLVYRKSIDVKSNNVVPGKQIMDRIESGIDYQQTLITFGHE